MMFWIVVVWAVFAIAALWSLWYWRPSSYASKRAIVNERQQRVAQEQAHAAHLYALEQGAAKRAEYQEFWGNSQSDAAHAFYAKRHHKG